MRNRKFLTTIIAFILIAFSADNIANGKSDMSDILVSEKVVGHKIQKTIMLDNNFKIEVGRAKDYGRFNTYTLFILSHNNKQLYIDSTLTEYQFDLSTYPKVISADNGTFQVIVEVNNSPDKNYFKCFTVYKDKIQDIKKLPIFIADAANLDADKNFEFAGSWHYAMIEGDSGQFTAYNPIIYFELSTCGLLLDSTLTIERNKMIYGNFYGYDFVNDVEIKTKECYKKMNDEYDRITQYSKSNHIKK